MYRNSLNNNNNNTSINNNSHNNSFNVGTPQTTPQVFPSTASNSFKLTPIASNNYSGGSSNNKGHSNACDNDHSFDNDYKSFTIKMENFADNDYENDNNDGNFNESMNNMDYNVPPNSQHYPYEDVQIDMSKSRLSTKKSFYFISFFFLRQNFNRRNSKPAERRVDKA